VTDQQRAALRTYLEQGGGFIDIHARGDNSHDRWRCYKEELIGARFVGYTLRLRAGRIVTGASTQWIGR
jgi:hypothetical protein